MSAFERLQDKTFTPEKMTPIDWVIWNSRASLPIELLEQAADQLEHLTSRALDDAKALYWICSSCGGVILHESDCSAIPHRQ